MGTNPINVRHTPDGQVETNFRRQVRDALNLDEFTRDDVIVEELRKLKRLEARIVTLEAQLDRIDLSGSTR